MPYRCAIIDDEPLAIELLKSYVQRMEQMELVMATDDLGELSRMMDNRGIDLVLLDVNLYGKKTVDLNELMQRSDCRFIIVTAYSLSSLSDMPQINRHGYLPKPVSFNRFREQVNKILNTR